MNREHHKALEMSGYRVKNTSGFPTGAMKGGVMENLYGRRIRMLRKFYQQVLRRKFPKLAEKAELWCFLADEGAFWKVSFEFRKRKGAEGDHKLSQKLWTLFRDLKMEEEEKFFLRKLKLSVREYKVSLDQDTVYIRKLLVPKSALPEYLEVAKSLQERWKKLDRAAALIEKAGAALEKDRGSGVGLDRWLEKAKSLWGEASAKTYWRDSQGFRGDMLVYFGLGRHRASADF